MRTFVVLLIGLVLFVVWQWYVRMDRRVKAANNAVIAKLTFGRLDKDMQFNVIGRSLAICHELRGGLAGLNLSEVEELLLFSLAMRELGIPPAYRHMKSWHLIRNPFLAIRPDSRILRMVSRSVSETEGVELTIDDRDPWADSVVSRLKQRRD
jgi:hypothetical protein